MAGIENLKVAVQELSEVVKDLKLIFEDGLTASDGFKIPGLLKDLFDVYSAARKAKEAGEISDLDFEEIRVLIEGSVTTLSDLAKSVVY